MSGNLNQQAQEFLEGIFGEGHKYEVVDGIYGNYMDVWVEGAKDYEVKELHIWIDGWHWDKTTGYQEAASFRVIEAGSFFPPISPEAYEEIDDWDESFRSKGYDCSYEEIWEELRTKVREWYENSDWMEVEMEYQETFGDPGDCSFMLNIKPLSLETLEPHNVPKLDEINDFLKELKETIDSHKKK